MHLYTIKIKGIIFLALVVYKTQRVQCVNGIWLLNIIYTLFSKLIIEIGFLTFELAPETN